MKKNKKNKSKLRAYQAISVILLGLGFAFTYILLFLFITFLPVVFILFTIMTWVLPVLFANLTFSFLIERYPRKKAALMAVISPLIVLFFLQVLSTVKKIGNNWHSSVRKTQYLQTSERTITDHFKRSNQSTHIKFPEYSEAYLFPETGQYSHLSWDGVMMQYKTTLSGEELEEMYKSTYEILGYFYGGNIYRNPEADEIYDRTHQIRIPNDAWFAVAIRQPKQGLTEVWITPCREFVCTDIEIE